MCPHGKHQPNPRHTAPQEPQRASSPLAFPAGQSGPNTLPETVAASLCSCQLGDDSLHPWVPAALPAGSHPSQPIPHPKPSCSPRVPRRSIPGVGWRDRAYLQPGVLHGGAGADRPAAAAGWQCHLEYPWCPRGWRSGSGSGHGTASTSACFQARLLLLLYLIKGNEGGTCNFSRLSERRNSLRLQSQFSLLKG